MFVLTADQIDSRHGDDLVTTTLAALNESRPRLLMPAERTVGDELQLMTEHADDALALILELTRTGRWSVGCGIGAVEAPLPASIREATGTAFIAARTAVERAKRTATRFALEHADAIQEGHDAAALIDLLLVLRARRSTEGWEAHELLESGHTQAEAAARLGITPQAMSDRARTAELRTENAARPALVRILEGLASLRAAPPPERRA